MPRIKNYTDTFLGEITINFSVKNNKFEIVVDRPVGFTSDEKLNDWDSVERYLEQLKVYKKYDSQFIRKVIHLDFQSTELGTDEVIPSGIKLGGTKMKYGVGFTMNWYVCDEFSTYWMSDEWKNSPNYYPSMGGNTTKYTIVEAYDGHGDMRVGATNILGQLFYGDGITLDYSDELYNFLIDTQYKLQDIIQKLANFINPDPKILLQNIANNQLRLGE